MMFGSNYSGVLKALQRKAKSKQIRDLLGMYQMDPEWTLPSMVDQNPLIWMLEVNGFIEEAYPKGLIPYIPAE